MKSAPARRPVSFSRRGAEREDGAGEAAGARPSQLWGGSS